jgi:hypothetical protein
LSNLPFSLTGDRMMTSTWQRSYFASVETGKKVVLCDWRLALLYHTLNLLILLLMFFNLRCRHTQHPLRIGHLGFGTGKRWTNPKLSRRTCSPRYGLPLPASLHRVAPPTHCRSQFSIWLSVLLRKTNLTARGVGTGSWRGAANVYEPPPVRHLLSTRDAGITAIQTDQLTQWAGALPSSLCSSASCRLPSMAELVRKVSDGQLLVATTASSRVTVTQPSPSRSMTDAQCAALLVASVPALAATSATGYVPPFYARWDAEHMLDANSTGTCNAGYAHTAELLIGAEGVGITVGRYGAEGYGGGGAIDVAVDVRVGGSSVARLQPSDVNQLEFSLADLLTWTGLQLDETLDSTSNSKYLPATTRLAVLQQSALGAAAPNARVSGVMLDVTMEYFNYPSGLFGALATSSNLKSARMVITPTLTWNRFEPEVSIRRDALTGGTTTTSTTRGGVTVNVRVGGAVARFDFFRFVAVLVQTAVLIGLSNHLVAVVACQLMGHESTLYREMLRETQSAAAAYARYAINLVVGSMMFDLLNRDKSGLIDHTELFHELKFLLGDRMDDAVRCPRPFALSPPHWPTTPSTPLRGVPVVSSWLCRSLVSTPSAPRVPPIERDTQLGPSGGRGVRRVSCISSRW